MKFTTIILLLFSSLSLKAEDIKTIIKDVMVYRQGAIVERSGNLNIAKGTSTIYLTGLSTTLDPESVRVAIENDNITIVSVNHEYDFDPNVNINDESSMLVARCNLLRDSIAWLISKIDILGNEKSLILENKRIGGDKGVSATELAAMALYFRKELTDLEQQILSTNKQLNAYQKELLSLTQKKQNTQKESHTLISRVKVIVSSENGHNNVPVSVSYLVNDAYWEPFYEIRIKETNQPLQLVYSAKVSQNTKENWENVKLTLSTGDPTISNVRPPFYTMYLPPINNRPSSLSKWKPFGGSNMVQGYIYDETGEAIIGASVSVEGSDVGCISDINGHFQLQLPYNNARITFSYIGYKKTTLTASKYMNVSMQEDEQKLEEVVVVGYGISKRNRNRNKFATVENLDMEDTSEAELSLNNEISGVNITRAIADGQIPMQINDNQSATEFNIDLPYTIPADNKSYDVKMLEYQIPAEYQYDVVPRYSKDVFLMARIPEWTQYALMNGNANLFLKNIYQGVTTINPDATLDTLSLSIGRDKDIAVTREEVRNFTSHSIIGSTRKVQKCWNITIKNNKNIPIEVEVEDQYPISKRDDIKVTLLSAGGAQADTNTGKLTWKIKLNPQSKQTVTFSYEVKYPKNYTFTVE